MIKAQNSICIPLFSHILNLLNAKDPLFSHILLLINVKNLLFQSIKPMKQSTGFPGKLGPERQILTENS